MCFILSPVIVLFGMIIFSGKPKDQLRQDEVKADETEAEK